MTANQIIHTAMGGLIGETKVKFEGETTIHKMSIPDYSQPEHIGKVYAWLRSDTDRATEFVKWIVNIKGIPVAQLLLLHMAESQIKLISEWITEG